MSYRLIIVDDEKAMRDSLAQIFDWSGMGFELCGTFADGRGAADYAAANPVDVVLTDITMPIMNGLELAKLLHETQPGVKTVLISGYQDFEFARRAIQYNVVHYLLKPTRYQEVTETFAAVKEQLDQEKKQMGEVLPMVARQFFFDLSAGVIRDGETIRSYLALLGLDAAVQGYPCCLAQLKIAEYQTFMAREWKHELEGFFNAMQQLLSCRFEQIQFYLFYQNDAWFQVIGVSLGASEPERLLAGSQRYFAQKQQEMQELLRVAFNIEQLDTYGTLTEFGEGNRRPAARGTNIQEEYRNLLLYYIQSGSMDAVNLLLGQYFDSFGQDVRQAQEMSLSILKELGETDALLVQELQASQTVEECRRASRSVFGAVMAKEQKNADASEKHLIHKAKEFIASHCCQSISLELVANNIFVSPVYLSRLFKEQTGQNFTDYVTQLRMQRAMELLRDPAMKVYEVSEAVGYKSLKYFYKIFKQYAGITPTEYRNNLHR